MDFSRRLKRVFLKKIEKRRGRKQIIGFRQKKTAKYTADIAPYQKSAKNPLPEKLSEKAV